MNPETIVWSAPLFDRTGFADEARGFILALDRGGLRVRADPFAWQPWQVRLTNGVAERIERLLTTEAPQGRFVHVVHGRPYDLRSHPRAAWTVARTMFETDGAPPGIAGCAEFDEIWVPSAFNAESFARAGIDRHKLHVVTEPLDAERFDRAVPPMKLAGLESKFMFLSVFSWHLRKGWDVLARAFLEEFSPDEAVVLALKFEPYPSRTPTVADARRQLASFVSSELQRSPVDGPPIVLLDLDLSDRDMPRLYRSADAYVMASRGEGWGRPYMEAMAMGLPTIGTRAGGNLEFMTDENSYLVDCSVVPVSDPGWAEVPWYRGHQWAEPSVAQLRANLRRVFTERGEAMARGARARDEVLSRYRWERVAETITARLEAAGVASARTPRTTTARASVVWEGDQFAEHSFAIVNREVSRALLATDAVELALRCDQPGSQTTQDRSLAGLLDRCNGSTAQPDVHVRHTWPPDLRRPSAGRWVVMQPWEFGSLPREWADRFTEADEIWVPSRHVRDGYVRSGLDPERVVVIPNGVNPLRFNPHAVPVRLPTAKSFRFLFVGGTLFRKGVDILLETYLRTFGPHDDVCLVIKDVGAGGVYRGQGLGNQIRSLQADPRNPEIVYLDGEGSHDEVAGLYAACQCLVHPYRAEGFGLPIAEAMACGLPVIVTGYGACLDFCDASTSYLVPAMEARSAVARLGDLETVEPPWWAEIDREALAQAMRDVVEGPEEARLVGSRARQKILRDHTWSRTADRILTRLAALTSGPANRSRSLPPAPAQGPRLSVCMIVRDEAPFLRACLESVHGLADQVVVVDTGSTDDTVAIAEQMGAEVHHVQWIDDFAAARNESLRHATGTWILVLDGDEAVDPASRDELRRLVQGNEFVGYLLHIVNYTAPVGTDQRVEHRTLRLFPNHPDLRFEGRDPHAQLRPRRSDLPYTVRPCAVTLLHEGYRPQVREGKGKLERNRVSLEQAVRDHPGDAFHRFNLGLTYNLMGRSADAEQELLRAVALALGQVGEGRMPTFLPHAYLVLGLATHAQQRYAETAAYCEQAIALDPGSSDAHVTLGSALARLGRLDEARAAYETALESTDGTSLMTDPSTASWKPLLGLAEAELIQQRWTSALHWLARAHELAPDHPTIASMVAIASLELGDTDAAEEILAALSIRDDAPPDTHVLLAALRGEQPAPS